MTTALEIEKIVCQHCGAVLDVEDNFCRHCGVPLGDTAGNGGAPDHAEPDPPARLAQTIASAFAFTPAAKSAEKLCQR